MKPTVIDARGLKCPLPVLKVQKALRESATGTEIRLLATDRNVQTDIVDLCRMTCDTVLENTEEDGIFRITIRKA